MTGELTKQITTILRDHYSLDITPTFTRPEESHGDFATNIALQVAGKVDMSPREVATKIVEELTKYDNTLKIEIAGPGFINIRMSDSDVMKSVQNATILQQPLVGKVIVAEYSDANAFKALHAGHLYTSLVGDAVANILQAGGGEVKRVNFGGDIGMHVGRAMWAIIRELGGEYPEKLDDIPKTKRAEWVSGHYVEGTQASKEDEVVKAEIIAINKRVYELHSKQDKASNFAKIYWICRQWSYDGFDELYEQLGMHPFDKYYPESAVWELGLETVEKQIGPVYEKSDGAVIFRGEKYGFFTQVFITSEGLPTYAGKDVGLIQHKYMDFKYDLSYIITDVAQKDHLSVVMKSIEQFEPKLVQRTVHHTHGRVKFADGRKMSSREGNVVMANDVIAAAEEAANSEDQAVTLGAIRYAFLKNRIGGDIAYDPVESVAQEGNSGPYLQYALVRARSILRKAEDIQASYDFSELDPAERSLGRKIGMYQEAFSDALTEYSPHHICTYLYELSQTFNRFYEKSRVIGDPRASERKALVESYEKVLSHGLGILGMPKPEKM